MGLTKWRPQRSSFMCKDYGKMVPVKNVMEAMAGKEGRAVASCDLCQAVESEL